MNSIKADELALEERRLELKAARVTAVRKQLNTLVVKIDDELASVIANLNKLKEKEVDGNEERPE